MATVRQCVVGAIAVVWVMAMAACRDPQSVTSPEELRNTAVNYAPLKRTWETRHQALRDELARVREENGLPDSMGSRRIEADGKMPAWQRPDGTQVPDDQNAALAMLAACPPEKRRRLQRQIEKAYPPNVLRCSSLQLERIGEVLETWSEERQAFQKALKLPDSDFGFSYAEGLTADLTEVEIVLLGHRLVALELIDHVYRNDLDHSVSRLSDLFTVSSFVAAEANLTMRSAAAQMRREALQIMELIVQHPSVSRSQVEQMREVVDGVLTTWTDDAWAWRGERALGLHAFEMVRDGQILSLLSAEEAQRVVDEGPQRFGRAVQKNIDGDQLFYLRTMREVIELCERPYFQRMDRIAAIEREMTERRGGPNEAIVSELLLSKDLVWGQRLQAIDRTAMEVWWIALSASLGEDFTEAPGNWFTGQTFTILKEGSRIEISGINPPGEDPVIWNEPLVVPSLSAATIAG